jgi:hypothetical protein
MRVYHKLLSHPGMRYEDLGWDYYKQERNTARQVSDHLGKLASLGYQVTLRKPRSRPWPLRGQPGHLTWPAPSRRHKPPPAINRALS